MKAYDRLIAIAFMFLSNMALAQSNFKGQVEDATKEVADWIMIAGSAGFLGLGGLIVLSYVYPTQWLEDKRKTFWGGFITIIGIALVMQLVPSVGTAVNEVVKCPVSIFGMKCR